MPYMYVFVRTDIPLADQMVQVGHVCADAGKLFRHPEHTHLVLLAVASEAKLQKVRKKLTSWGINHAAFHEPDDDMGYTSIATRAIVGIERELFSKYQLWSIQNETA